MPAASSVPCVSETSCLCQAPPGGRFPQGSWVRATAAGASRRGDRGTGKREESRCVGWKHPENWRAPAPTHTAALQQLGEPPGRVRGGAVGLHAESRPAAYPPRGLAVTSITAERQHVCRQEKQPLFITVTAENGPTQKRNAGEQACAVLPPPCPPGPPARTPGRAPRVLAVEGRGAFVSSPREVLGTSVLGLAAVREEKARDGRGGGGWLPHRPPARPVRGGLPALPKAGAPPPLCPDGMETAVRELCA